MEQCKTCNFFEEAKCGGIGDCSHPKMDIDKEDSLIFAGAKDNYDAYFNVSPEFGCILHETGT